MPFPQSEHPQSVIHYASVRASSSMSSSSHQWSPDTCTVDFLISIRTTLSATPVLADTTEGRFPSRYCIKELFPERGIPMKTQCIGVCSRDPFSFIARSQAARYLLSSSSGPNVRQQEKTCCKALPSLLSRRDSCLWSFVSQAMTIQ